MIVLKPQNSIEIIPYKLKVIVPDNEYGLGERIGGADLFVGNKAKLRDITSGNGFLVVQPGENIQEAINKVDNEGGGTVFLVGTHVSSVNITVPTGVHLTGENPSITTLDFNSNTVGLRAVGSNTYSTGTVAVTNNSTTVTGTSTVFTAAMIGREILLSGIWYPITARASDTSITIAAPFASPTISTASYVIATIVEDVTISNMLITSSNVAALTLQYTKELRLINIDVEASAVGIDVDDSSQMDFDHIDLTANNAAITLDNVHFSPFKAGGILDCLAGIGWDIDNCTNLAFDSYFILNSSGDGIEVSNSNNLTFSNCAVFENGGHGIELAGNNRLSFSNCAMENNATDGIQFTGTTDFCVIEGCSFANNGAYGIDITSGSSDNNSIYGNQFNDNTSGAINDSGDGTQIGEANIGLTIVDYKKYVEMKNTSGGLLNNGELVILKAVAAGDEVTTTTTQGDDLIFGMVSEGILDNASGRILISGKTTALKVDGTTDIAIGDFIGTFTTASIGMKAAAGDMAMFIALEAYTNNDSNGIIDALLISPRKI